MEKLSKVEKVTEVKQWGQGDRLTYYHNLIMENGDKINIGKKKQLAIGEELKYEIIGDEGQHEYTKARTPKEAFTPKPKNDDYIKGIEVGHAVNNAVNLICAGVELDVSEVKNTEEKIYKYAKVIMAISNRLKKE